MATGSAERPLLRRGPSPAARHGPARGWVDVFAVVWTRWLPVTLVIYGVAVRLAHFLSGRSQWLDEIMLSINIIEKSYWELLRPLRFRQAAPPGYLFVERTFVSVLGDSDYVLRLLSLIAGTASVLVFWRLARQLLSRWAVPGALLVFVTSPWQIYYAAEAKQYSCEVLASLLIAWATVWLCRSDITLNRALMWGGVGAATLWFSYSAVLVLGAATLAVLITVSVRRHRQETLAAGVGSLLWAASFLVTFSIAFGQVGRDPQVFDFWMRRHAFAPQPPQLGSTLSWLPTVLHRFVVNPMGSTAGLLLAGLFLVGLGVLARRGWGIFAIVVAGTVCAAIAAAVLGRYPLGERLALYLAPLVTLTAAAAIDLPTNRRYLRAVPLVLLLLAFDRSIAGGIGMLANPPTRSESRPVLQHVAANRQPGDLIVGHVHSSLAFSFYGKPLHLAPHARFTIRRAQTCDDAAQLAPVRIAGRFWLVFTHQPSGEPADSFKRYLSRFETIGHVVDEARAPGAEAYLLQTDRPARAPADVLPWPEACLWLTMR